MAQAVTERRELDTHEKAAVGSMNRDLRTNLPRHYEWLTKWEYMEGSGNFFWCPEIATIEDQGKIIYDGSVCPVHHTQMQRGELEIHYGLPTQELLSAMRADFSGGPGFILGGCLRGSEKATFGFRCEACIAAYKKWQNDYTKNHEKGEQAAPSEGDKPPK